VVSKFIRAALKGEDITIYGDGSQTRTFCYIDDNVEACVKCLTEDYALNDVINVGGAVETTILDLAKIIIKLTKSDSKIVHLPALEEGDMTRRMPDNSKMLSILGRDLLPIEEGIKRILADTSYIV
jgi:UDP-glucose 4-epimerase